MLPKELESLFIEQTDVKPGHNYTVWKAPRLTPEIFESLDTLSQLRYLASMGHLAMSTHNSQPWAFKPDIRSQGIEIFLDKNRVLPASDKVGRQSCISVGCAAANIKTAAGYFGYPVEITVGELRKDDVKPTDSEISAARYVHMAYIKLHSRQGQTSDRKTFEAIFNRRVVRSDYMSTAHIDDETIEQIRRLAQDNGISLTLFTAKNLIDRTKIGVIAEAQLQADSYVVNNDFFRRELAEWFKPNDTDSYLGMPGDTFGLPDKQTDEVYEGLRGLTEQKMEDFAGFAIMGKRGIESSPLVGVVSVAEDTPAQWLKAGMTLQETAIIMEVNKMGIAVHAGLAEVDWVSRSVLKPLTLKRERPVVLFRAGKPIESRPHSPRLPYGEVVIG